MKDIDVSEVYAKIMLLLEQHLGANCEVVLHDLAGDYDHTIVDIRNGHITGRKIGGCGSNLGLEVIRGTVKDGDKFNYITHTSDGRILRSSSVFLHDSNGKVAGGICINQDITDTIRFESFLRQHNQYNLVETQQVDAPKEVFVKSISELLEFFVNEGQAYVGKDISEMTRCDKIKMVGYLDKKGVFQIQKSSERICEVLKISRYTLYHYLELTRSDDNAADEPPQTDL